MKKLLLILVMAFLPLLSFCLSDGDGNGKVDLLIPLHKATDVKHERSICPVGAFYLGSYNAIRISTTSDMGEITVIVTNLTTGEVYNDSFDSSVLTESVVLVNGTPGVYEITLTSEYGDVYIGNFIID